MNTYQYGDMSTRYEVTVTETTPGVFSYKIDQVRVPGEFGPIPCSINLHSPDETFASDDEAKTHAESLMKEVGILKP